MQVQPRGFSPPRSFHSPRGYGRHESTHTHLAFRILFGNVHGPCPGSGPTLQDPPRSRDRREYEPVVEHHVEDAVHVLEALNLILCARGTVNSLAVRGGQHRLAYIVHRSKVYPILKCVSLELSVAVNNDLPISVVDGNRLGIAELGLATLAKRPKPDGGLHTLRSWRQWARLWSLRSLQCDGSRKSGNTEEGTSTRRTDPREPSGEGQETSIQAS